MEITYIGHSCFKVKGKNLTLIFDPYNPEKTGFKLPKLEANVVLVSHGHDDHNFISGISSIDEGQELFIINGPGEYEIKGAHVQGLSTYHDDKQGKERGKNTIYYVELDGLYLLHLGDLGHMPSDEILEQLNSVDVLFVPVGGTYTIDYKVAADVISEIEPSFVVPMHYQTDKLVGLSKELDPLDKFISSFGSDVVRKESKLKISGKSDLPEETQVVVLEQQ